MMLYKKKKTKKKKKKETTYLFLQKQKFPYKYHPSSEKPLYNIK